MDEGEIYEEEMGEMGCPKCGGKEVKEREHQEFMEDMNELLPQLDPLWQDEDDREWSDMLAMKIKKGNLTLGDPIF